MIEFAADGVAWPATVALPHPAPFRIGFEVTPASLSETVPHLNNVEILRLIDRAAEAHLDALGSRRRSMAEKGRMWFVARHEIDYRAEAFGGDRLLAATWVRRYGRTTCERATRIVRLRDAVVVAEAATRWVHMNLETRRPARIPAATVEACPPEPGLVEPHLAEPHLAKPHRPEPTR